MDTRTLRSLPAGLVDLFTDPRASGLTIQYVVQLIDLYEQSHMTASVDVWLELFNGLKDRKSLINWSKPAEKRWEHLAHQLHNSLRKIYNYTPLNYPLPGQGEMNAEQLRDVVVICKTIAEDALLSFQIWTGELVIETEE